MTTQIDNDLASFLAQSEVQLLVSKENEELRARRAYRPSICEAFTKPFTYLRSNSSHRFEIDPEARRQLPDIIENQVQDILGAEALAPDAAESYRRQRTIGVVFSGGPAPGGHNVIAGIYDAAVKANPQNKLLGFLMGPDGIVENEAITITGETVDSYRNLGGFGMIKTGRTKIDSHQKMNQARDTCQRLGLDALVVIGGDDSNTNAAFLAQALLPNGIQVIGVPKTIDGDIQVRDADGQVLCAMSFGFHSAARAFATEISNLSTDCSSDIKYWHVCKVMGRVASHLALEVALQTHANLSLVGEDLADYVDQDRLDAAAQKGTVDYSAFGITLRHLSRVICNAIVRRATAGKNYGVLVIPEGVLEFINEIQVFIIKLNTIIADYDRTHDTRFHKAFASLSDQLEYLHRLARDFRKDQSVTIWSERDDDLFGDLPSFFQEGLLAERDSHGNFQFSQVQTEKVLMGLVKDYLEILREQGEYKIGIPKEYYRKTLERDGLDPDRFGPPLFINYDQGEILQLHKSIISLKTLRQLLLREGLITEAEDIPGALRTVYLKTEPNFKIQNHFYGYDGRGSDPTLFDCDYTYNLGLTVFSLIANGATGQMAAIRNLEKQFAEWRPIGIPIAPLMHLEERKGKLALVIEKSVVDLRSNAFQVAKHMREKWLAAHSGADEYRRPGPNRLDGQLEEKRPITLTLNGL